jgi:hypothetical protein
MQQQQLLTCSRHMVFLQPFTRLHAALLCFPAEETNTRVAWFSIVSLAVCVGSACCQLLYLKKFFQRKKLL